MNSTQVTPPRWAEAMLRWLLRPSDRESVSADLLATYRNVRRPALGRVRADAWYVTQLLPVLWHLMWPWTLMVVAVLLLAMKVKALSYGSLVQAPLVALADGLVYSAGGYFVSRRTGLTRTATVVTCAASVVAFTVQFTAFAIVDPSLLAAPFADPFIFVILAVYLLIALTYAAVAGSIGGAVGRWLPGGAVERAPAS